MEAAGVREHGDDRRGIFLYWLLCIDDTSLASSFVYITLCILLHGYLLVLRFTPLSACGAVNNRELRILNFNPCDVTVMLERSMPPAAAGDCLGLQRRVHHARALLQQPTSAYPQLLRPSCLILLL